LGKHILQIPSILSEKIRADASLWVSRAETAGEIDDKSNQQNQAKPAAADDRPAKVKPATAEQ
jgi:hypothetical protein